MKLYCYRIAAVIGLWLHCTVTQGQSIAPEQTAFNYFITSVYVPDKAVKWSFSGLTDTMVTRCILGSCFENGASSAEQWATGRAFCTQLDSVVKASKLVLPGPIEVTQGAKYVRLKWRWLHQKNRMKIYRESVLGNKHFVMIELVEVHHFTNLYLFELDDNQNIVKWCLRSDIW